MTQETALKLALKAFEQIFESTPPYRDDGTCVINDKSVELSNKAIAAIKEALAQPKKEPIAYINVEKRTLEFAKKIFWHTPTVANLDRIPLYTQRTWVGLFDEEIEVLFQTAAGADEEVHIRFARAIESKLKEVNT